MYTKDLASGSPYQGMTYRQENAIKQLLVIVTLAATFACAVQSGADAANPFAVGGQTQDIPTISGQA